MANPVGNPNQDIAITPKPGATTEMGKFFRDIHKFKLDKVPPELLELYAWVKGMDTRQVDYLIELKNLYYVMQKAMMPVLIDKMLRGEMLNKREIDNLRLIKETLVDSHKLKYGDKKVIENIVTVADIRKQMRSDQKIIDVKAISEEKENVV